MLRIGTWNVEYALGTEANARRRAVMDACPADIWVLTETHDSLSPGPGFQPVHSDQRPYFGKSVKAGSRWVSIWSRYPILTRIRLDRADCERTTAALVATPFGLLIVYGTVLPWHSDTGRCGEMPDAPRWSVAHRVIPMQIEEWRELRRLLPDAQLCVAGDYNMDMLTGATYGTKHGISMLHDGLADTGLYCATSSICTEGGWLERAPIDHIALPLEWRDKVCLASAWEGRVGSPRLSDHSGMVMSVNT